MRRTFSRAALALLLGSSAGCLENLNQQKYFEKVRNQDGQMADRLRHYQPSIEGQLDEAIRGATSSTPTRITHWGEGWDFVRVVMRDDKLLMRGRVFFSDAPAAPYFISFAVDSSATVAVDQVHVYERLAMQGSTP